MMPKARLIGVLLVACVAQAGEVQAADLFAKSSGDFASLASDRSARMTGDSLTVLVLQASSATNSTTTRNSKQLKLGGAVSSLDGGLNEGGDARVNGGYDSGGAVERTGRLVAQISVRVDEVLPNGDLMVSGEQRIRVNGDRTYLKVVGRVRLADIAPDNTILSSRISDLQVEYSGEGFFKRDSGPNAVQKLLAVFGVR